MSRPIILWKPRNTIESDEACTTIVKYSLPPAPIPGPYDPVESISRNAFTYVQSLRQLCIRRLAEFPDQVHLLGSARVHYRIPESEEEFDLVRALTPGYSHDAPTSSAFLARVDPRLWGTMVQAIAPLPPAFRMYTLPLSDVHMPLLQRIPSTPDFSLITVLELYGQRDLDDETVIQLGELHTLTALDVGMTTLTPWGIRTLSKTLAVSEDGGTRMGPWGLRILSLRNCMKITDKVFEYLSGFPLLSVVDLRGTRCIVPPASSEFRASNDENLYHPTPLSTSLSTLASYCTAPLSSVPELFSHPEPFILRVSSLHHKIPAMDSIANLAPRIESYQYSGPRRDATHDALSGFAMDERDAAATEEVQSHASSRRALAFYAPMPKPKKPAAPAHPPASRNKAWKPDPLALFRPPPPYSTLDLLPSLNPAVSVSRSIKRKRSEEALHGDQARRNAQAQQRIQALRKMINNRAKPHESGHEHGELDAGKVQQNPFLRRAEPKKIKKRHEPFEIDPDLQASVQRDRDRNKPGMNLVAANLRLKPSTFPVIDPALLASAAADRHMHAHDDCGGQRKTKKRKSEPIRGNDTPHRDRHDSDNEPFDLAKSKNILPIPKRDKNDHRPMRRLTEIPISELPPGIKITPLVPTPNRKQSNKADGRQTTLMDFAHRSRSRAQSGPAGQPSRMSATPSQEITDVEMSQPDPTVPPDHDTADDGEGEVVLEYRKPLVLNTDVKQLVKQDLLKPKPKPQTPTRAKLPTSTRRFSTGTSKSGAPTAFDWKGWTRKRSD